MAGISNLLPNAIKQNLFTQLLDEYKRMESLREIF